MPHLFRFVFPGALALVAALVLLSGTALAHERSNVGKYQLVVGFIVEPPIEGEKNGVDLRVTNAESTQQVEGLEKTLKVEITQGAASKVFDLRAIFRDPGHYTADLIPTAPGQYVFRFFGTIEGLEMNERFESGPGRFNDVQGAEQLQFPVTLPGIREVAGVSQASQQAAAMAQDAASSAKGIAAVALAVGVIGVLAGLGAIVAVSRRRLPIPEAPRRET